MLLVGRACISASGIKSRSSRIQGAYLILEVLAWNLIEPLGQEGLKFD